MRFFSDPESGSDFKLDSFLAAPCETLDLHYGNILRKTCYRPHAIFLSLLNCMFDKQLLGPCLSCTFVYPGGGGL